jgi:hypothetical protein
MEFSLLETLCSVQKYIFVQWNQRFCCKLTQVAFSNCNTFSVVPSIINENAKTCCFNKREHLFQIYPPLSHYDHLAVKLKTTALDHSFLYFRIHFNGSTDSLMSSSKSHLVLLDNKHICLYYRYLEPKKPSFEF